MAAESSTSNLPWLWIVEYLASNKKVEMATLNDLISRTSKFSDDLGKNARERVSLRCLEDLFDLFHGTSDLSTPDSKIGFDLSETCEHVLHRVASEASSTDMRKIGPELLKWDASPFILHKKASLPKCALELLKENLIKSAHMPASFLMGKSGLRIQDQNTNTTYANHDNNADQLISRFCVSSTDHHVNSVNGKKSCYSPNNTIMLPSKRDRSASTDRNLDMEEIIGNVEGLEPSSKKFKAGFSHSNQPLSQGSIEDVGGLEPTSEKFKAGSSHGNQPLSQDLVPDQSKEHLGNSCRTETTAVHSETVVCNTTEESGQRVVKSKKIENVHDASKNNRAPELDNSATPNQSLHTISTLHLEKEVCNNTAEELGHSVAKVKKIENVHDASRNNRAPEPENSAAPNGIQHKISTLHLEKEVCNNTEEDIGQRLEENNNSENLHVSSKKSKRVCDDMNINLQCNSATPNGTRHDKAEENSGEDTDNDEYEVEKINISTTKHNFLSSQCTYSENPASTDVWTDQNLCMKCNKNDQLLHCCANECPLVVHESCMGYPANFDNEGNFYCPFCLYSRSIVNYLEAKKKASIARKKLNTFLSLGCQKENLSSVLHKERKPRKTREVVEELMGQEKNTSEMENQINTQKNKKFVDNRNQIDTQEISGSPSFNDEDNQGGVKKIVEERRSLRRIKRKKCVSNQSLCREPETIVISWGKSEVPEAKKKVIRQEVYDSKHDRDIEGTSTKEKEDKLGVSRYSLRVRSPNTNQHITSCPTFPMLRRIKVPWTAEEEDTLKEGVRRCFRAGDKAIPWKEILEFGDTVFHSGRTSMDLRDKWRNICKRIQ